MDWHSAQFRFSLTPLLPLLLVSLGLVPACTKSIPPGTLVVANNADVQSLDPQLATGAPEGRVLSALFSGLTRIDPSTLKVLPELAEHFSSPDGGYSWEFRLRPNLQWSDGSALGAMDVLESWERLQSPATAAPYRDWLHDLTEGGLVVEDNILRVKFQSPKPFFPGMCAYHALAPIPPGLRDGSESAGKVTSGPFLLGSRRIRDRIQLQANPHYWNERKVHLPGIVFLTVESQFTALNLFLTGEAHFIPDVPALAVSSLYQREKQLIRDKIRGPRSRPEFDPQPFLATYFYRFNTTQPPFDDARVRRALSLAVDRTLLAKTLGSGQPPAKTLIPNSLPNWDGPDGHNYDPETARRLLREAGYDSEHPFPKVELHYNTAELHRDVAEALQAQWRMVLGIETRLYNQEWKVFLDAQKKLDYQLSRSSWIGDYLDPTTFLDVFRSDSPNNRTGWKDQRYDLLLEKAKKTTHQQPRMHFLRQAEEQLLREAPIMPLFHYAGRELVSSRVQGYRRNLLGTIHWAGLHLLPSTQAEER